MSFKVISTGPQALFQDRGRFGFASSGVGTSGAFDRLSAARANHALGNDPNATVIEILLGGFEVEAQAPSSIVFTGTEAEVKVRTAGGQSKNATTNTIIDVAAGDRIRIEPATYGMRAYFGVRGGFLVEETLGSASTDLISHLGPAPIQEGEELAVGTDIADHRWWPKLRQLPVLWKRMPAETLTVIRGPRDDWFTQESLNSFFSQVFTVSNDSNRIGLRMEATTPLRRRQQGELKSEGMVRGSIQIPPGGNPVVFGPDHPVTGGYPVIAVLTARSCDRSAQLLPGDKVRFRLA
ncbi:allophanate hydrolase subunit 2 [Corynebacterium suranareeae]|uniref:Allophanate hydrolase subunit 2 n=1 Tax=Corynebacterium suranareeae TaxID=2506452 RepID=A0A160PQT0_9CORY|nr:biotin-dependent carboxyltransferase family protein [Corynebacterium suranareeae]BAU95383.1 allophanate hydrolase subunit 2 [Corynebacterium suranareeae]